MLLLDEYDLGFASERFKNKKGLLKSNFKNKYYYYQGTQATNNDQLLN